MNKIILSLILGILLIGGIVIAERFEDNLFKYGTIDSSGNLVTSTTPITNVNTIGFVCSNSDCSSVSGTLWGGNVLNTPTDFIQLTYPTSLSSIYGYGVYFYKDGYIPYEVNADWWGTNSGDPVGPFNNYLSKKQNCTADVSNLNVSFSGGNINVKYNITSPIGNAGPLSYIPPAIESHYQVRVNTTLRIYKNSLLFYTESKTLDIPYSGIKNVNFNVPATQGTYSVDIQTSTDDSKCLDYTPITKNEAVCVPSIEICNGIDDDCDGLVDEGNVCASGFDFFIDNGYIVDSYICEGEEAAPRFHNNIIGTSADNSGLVVGTYLDNSFIMDFGMPFPLTTGFNDWGVNFGFLSPGNYLMKLVVDPLNLFVETNESNNVFEFPFTVYNSTSCPKNQTNCTNYYWFDNTHPICGYKQFCGAFSYLGLRIFNTLDECNATLHNQTDTTAPGLVTGFSAIVSSNSIFWNWTNPSDSDFLKNIIYIDGVNVANTTGNSYNAVGLQANTTYTITVKSADISGNVNAGANDSRTTLLSGVCTPNWQCTSWSNCVVGLQARTCSDMNSCGVTIGKPTETQTCSDNDDNDDNHVHRTTTGNIFTGDLVTEETSNRTSRGVVLYPPTSTETIRSFSWDWLMWFFIILLIILIILILIYIISRLI